MGLVLFVRVPIIMLLFLCGRVKRLTKRDGLIGVVGNPLLVPLFGCLLMVVGSLRDHFKKGCFWMERLMIDRRHTPPGRIV